MIFSIKKRGLGYSSSWIVDTIMTKF